MQKLNRSLWSVNLYGFTDIQLQGVMTIFIGNCDFVFCSFDPHQLVLARKRTVKRDPFVIKRSELILTVGCTLVLRQRLNSRIVFPVSWTIANSIGWKRIKAAWLLDFLEIQFCHSPFYSPLERRQIRRVKYEERGGWTETNKEIEIMRSGRVEQKQKRDSREWNNEEREGWWAPFYEEASAEVWRLSLKEEVDLSFFITCRFNS